MADIKDDFVTELKRRVGGKRVTRAALMLAVESALKKGRLVLTHSSAPTAADIKKWVLCLPIANLSAIVEEIVLLMYTTEDSVDFDQPVSGADVVEVVLSTLQLYGMGETEFNAFMSREKE